MRQNKNITKCKYDKMQRRQNTKIPNINNPKPPYSRPPPLMHWFSIGTPSILFRKICGNSCSHNVCGNSAVPTRIVGTENWFPIGCSDKFVGLTVPTKIVGTANCGFLLAVPTNLSEQYTFYNAAYIPLV